MATPLVLTVAAGLNTSFGSRAFRTVPLAMLRLFVPSSRPEKRNSKCAGLPDMPRPGKKSSRRLSQSSQHPISPEHSVTKQDASSDMTRVIEYISTAIHLKPNQTMKPTPKGFASRLAPLRNEFSVFATTPWISSRCPATLVRFASARSRTPAVMLFNASRGLSLSR